MLLTIVLIVLPILITLFTELPTVVVPLIAPMAALVFWMSGVEDPPRKGAWGGLAVGTVLGFLAIGWKVIPAVLVAGIVLIALESLLAKYAEGKKATGPLVIAFAVMALSAPLMISALQEKPVFDKGMMPANIIAVGDSLTSGVPGDEVTRLWPTIVAEELDASLVNLSHPGDTLQDSLNRWEEQFLTKRFSNDAGWEPDLVIVLLGGNDILRKNGKSALREDLRRWGELLNSLEVPVLLIAVPGALVGDQYDGAWDDVADEFGFASMDKGAVRKIFVSPDMTLGDRIHFNQKGHEYLARQILSRLGG